MRSTSVDLPAPGGPVTPSTTAPPAWGKSAARSGAAGGPPSSTTVMARATARTSPRSTPSTRAEASKLPDHAAQREDLASDHEALHLARALADRAELRVAQVALD